jgi:nucleosome binding factor SPN SPT16 subunit
MTWEGNLNWTTILKQIVEDPEGFIEEGGWKSLEENMDADSSGEESEDDQSFVGEAEEEEESGSEEDSEFEEEEEEFDEEDEEDDEELSEEGLSWDELEKKAARGTNHFEPFKPLPNVYFMVTKS